jgi:hypothetical protein
MMTLSGVFIGRMTSDPCIAGIGECLGRGTLISIILVMFVLPQILLIGDKLIQLTTFDISTPVRTREETGTVMVNGLVSGQINGYVNANINGIIKGDFKAMVVSGTAEKISDEM